MDQEERPTPKDIVDDWAMEYGNRIPVLAKPKQTAFCDLFATFKGHGYSKDDAKNIKSYVIRICVPDNYKAKERNTWLKNTELCYNQALLAIFSPVLRYKADERNTIPPENYLPKTKTYEPDTDPDHMGDPAYQPIYDEYEEPTKKYKEVDKSRFAHIETTKPDFDDLFAELDRIGTEKEGADE